MAGSFINAMKFGSYSLIKRNRAPIYLIHFVTQRCTANCRHCFLAASADNSQAEELTLEEIQELTRKMNPLLFVFLTGGEPFLRDDLAGIAKAYHRNAGVQKIQCPSNGSFPDKAVAFAREVTRDCPGLHTSITLSFDAVGKKHDESRRCPGLFEKTVETFRKLKALESERTNFNVNATTTVSRFNQNDLEELYRFIRQDLNCSNYFNTLVRGSPRESTTLQVDLDRFEAFNEMLEKGLIQEGMRGYQRFPLADFINAKNLISRKLIADTARHKRFITPCYAGRIAGVIYPAGDVYPCELRDDLMGNLRDHEYDLNKIWKLKSSESIRKDIHHSKCFCTHECFITLNILFNPRYFANLSGQVMKLKWNRIKKRLTG